MSRARRPFRLEAARANVMGVVALRLWWQRCGGTTLGHSINTRTRAG